MSHALKPDASDEELHAAIKAACNIVEQVHCSAALAYRRAAGWPFAPRLGVEEFWQGYLRQLDLHRAHPMPAMAHEFAAVAGVMVKRLRLALDARDVLEAVSEDMGHISAAEARLLLSWPDAPGEQLRRRSAVMNKHPGLKILLGRTNAESDRLNAAQEAQRVQQANAQSAKHQREQTEAACDLVRRLALKGVTLALHKGGIAARPAALLEARDRTEIDAMKAELLALLEAPAELVA